MGVTAVAYTPTEKDLWNQQQQAAKEARRERDADRREANRIQQQMLKDERDAAARRKKLIADAEKEADTAAAAEEKRLLSEPRTRYTGATRKNPDSIIVWHHKVEPPAALGMKQNRHGLGPLLALRPGGGGFRTEDAFYATVLERHPRIGEEFPEYVTAMQAALNEATDYSILTVLRDDKKMAQIFQAAGVTSESKDIETMTGEYGMYKRTVTEIHVPELTDVVIRSSGLELTYRHRLGMSAADWNGTSKKEALRDAFRNLGVNAADMTITSTSSGDIKVAFNDKDPLSEPLPAVVTPYDEARGRSYLGRAADGSDIHLTWKNNASSLIAGMQGSGKTASLMPVIAGLAGKVELHIVDCGASGEWDIFEPICASYDDTGDLIAVANVMKYAMKASRERMKKIRSYGAINFWELSVEQRHAAGLHHMVIILEEAPMALGQGQSDPNDKKIAEVNMSQTGKVVKTVRKAGIAVVLVAQKPAANEIPTIIRDNAGQRVCFRLDSDVAAQTVLGDSAHVEPKPTSIPAGRPGRFVARVDQRGNVYGQSVYMPIEDIATYLAGQHRVPPMDESVPDPAPTPDNDDAPATPGPSPDVAVGNGRVQLDDRAQRGSEHAVFDDDQLLAALAEAQRRGLIPRPDEPEPPVTKPAPPQHQPKPQPAATPEPKGFDF